MVENEIPVQQTVKHIPMLKRGINDGGILRIEDLQKSIENPTWEEVYRYLKSLDGKNVTAVYLESKDGFLMAGGGSDKGQSTVHCRVFQSRRQRD